MIVFEGTGKAYRNRKGAINWIMRNVDATFRDGENTGILIPRGEGKTTFISLVAGNEAPSEGRIVRHGHVSWPYGSRVNLSNKLTGKQNLRFLTDVYGKNFTRAYEFVAEFCDLDRQLEWSLKQYTNEMRTRFSIGALLAMEFDHILVDDFMDGGDNAFRRRCARYFDENRDRVTLLMATSSVALVSRYCQRAGVLNEGRLTFYDTVDQAVEQFDMINEVAI